MNMDDAYVTPVVALHPSDPEDPGSARPTATIVVRFPGPPRLREVVLRALLSSGWQLSGSIGHFEPEETPLATVTLSAGHARIQARGETLYEGPLPADETWFSLAQAQDHLPVYVTVGPEAILTEEDADQAGRAGHLVGASATITSR